MSFANLEKVEVLGLPGVEGELRVRGDKTVTITNTNTNTTTTIIITISSTITSSSSKTIQIIILNLPLFLLNKNFASFASLKGCV